MTTAAGNSVEILLRFVAENEDLLAKSAQVKAAIAGQNDEIRKQFGITSDVIQRNVSQATATTSRMAEAAADATAKNLSAVEQHILSASQRLGDKQVARAMASETDSIIAQSQRAIVNLDSQVLHMRNNQQALGQAFDNNLQKATSFTAQLESSIPQIAATGLVIGTLVVATYELVKSQADAILSMKRLSDETGLTIETVSALSAAFKRTGADGQGASQALAIFDKNLSKAHDSTDSTSLLIRRMNLDLNDNEKALRQAFTALNSYKDSGNKTAEAQALFGRNGRIMLDIIKETNGNLDQAIAKYKALGGVLTNEDAAAAKEFNESMQDTWTKLNATARTIAEDLMPAVSGLASLISSTLLPVLNLLRYPLGILGKIAELTSDIIKDATGNADQSMSTEEAVGQAYFPDGSTGDRQAPFLPKRGGSAKEDPRIKQLEEQSKEIQRIFKNETEQLKNQYDAQIKNLEDYTAELTTKIHDSYEKRRAVVREQLALSKKPENRTKYANELTALDDEEQRSVHDANIQMFKTQADSLRKHLDEIEKIYQDGDKTRIAAIRALEEARVLSHQQAELRITEIEEAAAQRRFEALTAERERIIKNAGGDPAKANQERLKEIQDALDLWAAQERKSTIDVGDDRETKGVGSNVLERQRRLAAAHALDLEEEKKYRDEIAALQERYQERQRDNDRRMYEWTINSPYSSIRQKRFAISKLTEMDLDKLDQEHRHNIALLNEEEEKAKKELGAVENREWKKLLIIQHYRALKDQEDERHKGERSKRQDQGDEDVTFAGTGGSVFGALIGQFTDNVNIIQGGAKIVEDSLNNMAQAAGNAAKAWVLFGTIGGSFRKFAAETIAAIVQMAVVQAIFEGAQAAAMYGLFYFTGNANFLKSAISHGEAALTFGIVAAVAAPIGRGVAGNLFQQDQQQQGVAGGGSGSGNGGGYQPFNYNSSTFSASQAGAPGSRTGNVLADVLKEVAASNNRVADGHAQVAAAINYNTQVMRGIDSIPPGDMIRQNPYAVGDSLEDAIQSTHPIGKTIASMGSRGIA
jgi:hypothetical protein